MKEAKMCFDRQTASGLRPPIRSLAYPHWFGVGLRPRLPKVPLCASVDVRQLSARVGEAESQVVESKVQFRLGSGLTNRKGVFYPPARMDGVLRTTHPTFYMSGLE